MNLASPVQVVRRKDCSASGLNQSDIQIVVCPGLTGCYSFERFFPKTLKDTHIQAPLVINIDKNATYLKATDTLQTDDTLPKTTEFQQNKYLNNIIEPDRRFLKRLINPGMGFGSFNIPRRVR